MNKSRNMRIIIFISVLVFFAMFIGNYGNYQLSAVPGMVYQTYGLTDAQFSSLMTGPMIPSIFLSIVIGLLVDRYGISKIVGICFAISSIGFIVRVFATNYATMLIAMALTGVGCMVLNANLSKIVSALFPMDKVGTVVGIMMAGSTGSMAVAYATTALFPSLEIAFWLAAIVSIVISLLWILFVREKHFAQEDVPQQETAPIGESLKTCLKSRNVWLAGIIMLFLMGGAMVISNFQVTAMMNLKGFSESFAGTFGTVLMVGSLLGSIFVPMLVARFPKQTPVFLLVFGAVAAVCTVGLAALPTGLIYICCFLNGFLRSGVISVIMSLPVMFSEIGPKYAGTAGGMVVTLELIGGVVIPTYIVVPLGHGNIMTYFWLGALCILISAILCFIMANTCGVYKKEN